MKNWRNQKNVLEDFAQTIWQKEVSMEKELDLLIATEMSGDGDSVAEELRSVFAKRGVTVHRIEFRSGKDSVIRSVRANPQIHAVVLSQYQDQEKLSPRDIDQICSTAEGDLQVFVVVSEMRGSDYMKEIESLGIYTAVYQEDASFEKSQNGTATAGRKRGPGLLRGRRRGPCGPVSQYGRECQYPVSFGI